MYRDGIGHELSAGALLVTKILCIESRRSLNMRTVDMLQAHIERPPRNTFRTTHGWPRGFHAQFLAGAAAFPRRMQGKAESGTHG